MRSYDIRLAGEDDIPILDRLVELSTCVKTADYMALCMSEQMQGRRNILIGKLAEKDAGYCMLNRAPQYSLYKRLGIPEIQDLNVIPECRRRGLATALIRHCEELARRDGASQIGISVGLHSGFGAAQRLYMKLGYMPDGYGVTYDRQPITPGEIRPVDDSLCLMMVKDLA